MTDDIAVVQDSIEGDGMESSILVSVGILHSFQGLVLDCDFCVSFAVVAIVFKFSFSFSWKRRLTNSGRLVPGGCTSASGEWDLSLHAGHIEEVIGPIVGLSVQYSAKAGRHLQDLGENEEGLRSIGEIGEVGYVEIEDVCMCMVCACVVTRGLITNSGDDINVEYTRIFY